MATMQMNVRMDSVLKRAGDAALVRAGLTPTLAVRALWEYLAVHGSLPAEIDPGSVRDDAAPAPTDPREAGASIVAGFYERIGVDGGVLPEPDYEALRESLADERLAELERA